MSRRLEHLWLEIEAGLPVKQDGWVRRQANPGAKVATYVAVSCNGGARSLMIDIPLASIYKLTELPRTKGLSVSLAPPLTGSPADRRTLAVELEDRQFSDVFTIFCSDLVDGISACSKVVDAIVLLLRRLARWQEFLGKSIDGLGHGEMVGLFGELWVLRHILVPLAGIGMIDSWTGAQRAPQDFVLPGLCAVEVKTTARGEMSRVRIHGERQLDDTGLVCLYLACLRLEPDSDSDSLLRLVTELREIAAVAPEFSMLLDARLAQAGWLDRHADRYRQLRMRVAQRRFFRVNEHFPRLLPGALSVGVSDVEYQVDLRACDACECDEQEVAGTIARLQRAGDTQ